MGGLRYQGLRYVLIALPAAVLVCIPTEGLAQTLRLASGSEYARGQYGSRLVTESLVVTTSARYEVDHWTFGVTIPYVSVTGPGAPFDPYAISFFALAVPVSVSPDTVPLLSLPDDPSYFFPQIRLTSRGLGDVTVSGSRFFELKRNKLYLDASALVKLPTGDPQRLIGTGETDITLRSDLVYEDRDFGVFGGAAYTFTGESSRFDLQNRWQLSAGAYKSVGRRSSLGVVYDWREPQIANSKKSSEITAYVSVGINRRFSILAYTVAGLSDASPDFALGLRFAVDFDVGSRILEID